MNTWRFAVKLEPRKPFDEIIIAHLADLGFESFEETELGFNAYASEGDVAVAKVLESLKSMQSDELHLEVNHEMIPYQNWNAGWESAYPRVDVNERCIIRAPFHPKPPATVEFDICIQPQMSFGTGHHQTTYLMALQLLNLDLIGKAVLDMGCGTGVLAILAKKMGAGHTVAVDIEPHAVLNTAENAALNNVKIDVYKGGVEAVSGSLFDIILANINRNVLLADMNSYAKALNQRGSLMISGFFETDADELIESALAQGLILDAAASHQTWAWLKFQKNPF